jgi:hypothetical protein
MRMLLMLKGYQKSDIGYQRAESRGGEKKDGNTEVTEIGTQRAQR